MKSKAKRRKAGKSLPKRKVTRKEITVRRSSGKKEKLDTNRMAQTVSRSGVPFVMARDIAKKVTRKIKADVQPDRRKKTVRKTVTAGRVRGMVTKELRDRNRQDIASSYSGDTPENTRQERFGLENKNEPVLDNVAANKNNVMHDRSKRLTGAA